MSQQELRESQSRQRQLGPKTHLLAHVDGLPIVVTGHVVLAQHRRCVAEQPTKTDQVALESTGSGARRGTRAAAVARSPQWTLASRRSARLISHDSSSSGEDRSPTLPDQLRCFTASAKVRENE